MNLPESFLETMRATLGDAEAERLVTALAEDAPVSVRLNPLRNVVPAGAAQPVPWSSAGYYLAGRPVPFWRSGSLCEGGP